MSSGELFSSGEALRSAQGTVRRDRVAVTALLRTFRPAEVAASASRRLIQVVAEWRVGASLDIVMGARRGRRGVDISFTQCGVLQPDWAGDVAWALADLAVLSAPRVAGGYSYAPAAVLEIRAARELDDPELCADSDERTPVVTAPVSTLAESLVRQRNSTPWPIGLYTSAREVMGGLVENPAVRIRVRMSAASAVEVQMVNEALRSSWTGVDSNLHAYQGHPVRMRAFVASSTTEVPARFRALVQQGARHVMLQPLAAEEVAASWFESDAMPGHAIPEGQALALLHFPSAGGSPVPGIPTKHAAISAVPLDPMPARPERPVRLGRATTVGGASVDLSVDVTDLLRHVFVEGASGSGKSTVLTALTRGLAEIGCGFTVLEGHGATVDAIERALPADAVERVSVVRHGDTQHPVPLNILGGDPDTVERNIDVFAEMIQKMYDPKNDGIVGPRWRRWFGLVALGTSLVFGQRASLVHVAAIASDMGRVARLARKVQPLNREVAHRLQHEYGDLGGKESAEMISWGVSKLHPVVSSAAMRAILGTGADAVDVRQMMERRRGLLVDLAMPTLGVPAARLLGATWLMKHWFALGERNNPQEPHVLIVDEAHLFAYGVLPNMLTEGRKFGLGVVVANQSIDALHPNLKDALEANSGSFISLRSGLRDAARASHRLNGWPVEQLVRLPDLTAAATVSRGGIMSEPFTLEVDHHRRMKRLARPEQSEAQAMLIEERSRRHLWEPFSGLTAVSDQVIADSLDLPKAPPRPPAPRMPESAFLDEWMKKQAGAVAEQIGVEAEVIQGESNS